MVLSKIKYNCINVIDDRLDRFVFSIGSERKSNCILITLIAGTTAGTISRLMDHRSSIGKRTKQSISICQSIQLLCATNKYTTIREKRVMGILRVHDFERVVHRSFSSRWFTKKKEEKGNREKKGITDPRNSLAISIHPIGCHTYVRWKGFGDSGLQERGTEGVAKESLVHGRSTPAMRHIDFIFIPDRLPRRVREEVSVLKERFHPRLTSSPSERQPRVKTRQTHVANWKFRLTKKFVTTCFYRRFLSKKTYRDKNVNLQLRNVYGIPLNNRRSENRGGEQMFLTSCR